MARTTLRFLCSVVLLLTLERDILVFATTSVVFYTDDACQNSLLTVQTHTAASNGSCGIVDGAKSAKISTLDFGCSGIKALGSVSDENS